MRRQSDRYAINRPLEIFANGRKHVAELEDLSRTGMFLRLAPGTPPLPHRSLVHVALVDGPRRFVTSASVAHMLDETDARALGREIGVGLEFTLPTRPTDVGFADAVEHLLAHHMRPARAADRKIVIATSHIRLRERLSAVFGEAGFAVVTAANGLEAVATCLRARPDVLLVERLLPIIDGVAVLARTKDQPKLRGLPVVVMSDDPRDGIEAFELGAMDFIAKPFSSDELVLRVRRLARDHRNVVFRGELSALGLAALLTMFEQERKSGQLALVRDDATAWIDLVAGRIVNARSTRVVGDPHAVLLDLLDWTTGQFELATGDAAELPACELSIPLMQLLLEHARLSDESVHRFAM